MELRLISLCAEITRRFHEIGIDEAHGASFEVQKFHPANTIVLHPKNICATSKKINVKLGMLDRMIDDILEP